MCIVCGHLRMEHFRFLYLCIGSQNRLLPWDGHIHINIASLCSLYMHACVCCSCYFYHTTVNTVRILMFVGKIALS